MDPFTYVGTTVLGAVGFTKSGVVAGSAAAGIQSMVKHVLEWKPKNCSAVFVKTFLSLKIGPISSGSLFACAQSAGATGVAGMFGVAFVAGAGVVVAAGAAAAAAMP